MVHLCLASVVIIIGSKSAAQLVPVHYESDVDTAGESF